MRREKFTPFFASPEVGYGSASTYGKFLNKHAVQNQVTLIDVGCADTRQAINEYRELCANELNRQAIACATSLIDANINTDLFTEAWGEGSSLQARQDHSYSCAES